MQAYPTEIGTDQDGLGHYFASISQSQPLSREREVHLAARIKAGDMSARDELVKANLRFVVSQAKKFKGCGLPFADLIGMGNLGLMVAAERFDGTKGTKFISYAIWWIRQSMLQALAEQVRTVRLPTHTLALLQKMQKKIGHLSQSESRLPQVESVAQAMDIPRDAVIDLLIKQETTTTLDRTPNDDDVPLMDILADTTSPAPDAHLYRQSLRDDLALQLAKLDPQLRFVIVRSFGLDGNEATSLSQIGEQLHLSRERVRQLRQIGLNKLRRPATLRCLKAWSNEN